MISRFTGFVRAHKIVSALIGIVVLVAAVSVLRPKNEADTSIAVTRGDISETVSVTGQLEPVQTVDLSFSGSGRVAQVGVRVGDKVVAGQTLASLDFADLNAQLKNAQATVAAQQAKLDGLTAGSRPEDLAIAQAQLDKAQQDLENIFDSVYDSLSAAYGKADDAVRIQLLSLFTPFGTSSAPEYRINVVCACDAQTSRAVNLRVSAEKALTDWKVVLAGLSAADHDSLQRSIDSSAVALQTVRDLMNAVMDVLNNAALQLDLTALEAYKADVTAGLAETNSALSSVNTLNQSIKAQKIVVQQYANQLALKKAGSTTQDIAAQKAVVMAAQAQADQIQAQISKNIIRSPIAGTVTRVDAKVGQSAAPSVALLSVISGSQLEITANVPEVDIGKIAVGNHVDLTIDALPSDRFTASISFIDPAETIIDGVVNFKIKAVLLRPDERLKSGLTANLDIQSQYKTGVLILPQYAIIQNDQGTFVEKVEGKTSQQIPVTLGLRSADGDVEIISGLSEGDRVANIGLKK